MSEWDDAGGATGTEETLRRLEARLAQASEAAERLMREAAAAMASEGVRAEGVRAEGVRAEGVRAEGVRADGGLGGAGGGPGDGQDARERGRSDDLELLAQLAHRVRELIPTDLQRRLAEALRDLLLAVRALIDWYLERLERRRGSPATVTDIPID